MPTLAQARSHYDRQRLISAMAVRRVRSVVKRRSVAADIAPIIASFQFLSARTSSRSIAAMGSTPPVARPQAFVGVTSGGVPLVDPLESIMAQIDADTEAMLGQIDRLVASEVAEAGRGASQVEIVAGPDWTNYVRMLNPPSCARCTILAGRIYRDIEAFLRHPNCDCVMVPVTDWQDAHDSGLITSPQAAFDKGLVTGLSAADTKAIEDGADIGQVVNAHRGLYTAETFGRRVKATRANARGRQIRLRPEAIYDAAKDRADAIRLLKLHGYIR